MPKILVIADDLTGAAEMAGIATRFGLATTILRSPADQCGDGVTVIDTDSRLLAPEKAAQHVHAFIARLRAGDFDLIYKKTDSAVRGPIRAEIETILDQFGKTNAIFLPQNPSRGRTIRDGIYAINGVPLDQTTFANDPDHPAHAAIAADLLLANSACATGATPPSLARITICDATCADDVRRCAQRVDTNTLPAGGADFFLANLTQLNHRPQRDLIERLAPGATLFVCGSASAYSRDLMETLAAQSVPVIDVRDPASAALLARALDKPGRAMLAITGVVDRAAGASNTLGDMLAKTVRQVLSQRSLVNLTLEGGATASAVCRAMQWECFEVIGEFDTGIVQMRATNAPSPMLILKPGSYPWTNSVIGQRS